LGGIKGVRLINGKARSNTMPKAILEIEMPESCWQCELYSTAHNCCNVIVILGHYAICPSKGRRPDCPLKLVEENAFEKQIP